MTNIKVDLPRVHLARSDAHHNAHLEVGPHGFALFLSPSWTSMERPPNWMNSYAH